MKKLFLIILAAALTGPLYAGIDVPGNSPGKKSSNPKRVAANCLPSSASAELNINNVRALLHNGGDMWWDLANGPRYEVPKVDNPVNAKHASFASSLWIGGIDAAGQLRVAAQTYRQSGNDFFPGPLTSNGGVTPAVCEAWDKHYVITKAEIDAFRAAHASGNLNLAGFPAVKSWPAFGSTADGEQIALAPFTDVDGDPFTYSPESGDYPAIQGDQAIWWVINDNGDVHTATGGEAIGLEIQMMAFAFTTANAINNMTFYKYKVIKKSPGTLFNTYMGLWVDSDIGQPYDDYVGCDTSLGVGFAYNGDSNDDAPTGYGLNPPAFGTDFFQGPVADPGDGLDNDKDGLIDEPGERIGMQYFVYYENDGSNQGNPSLATHFYGYLRGFWKDGARMVDNGLRGHPGTAPGPVTNYMYPGDGGWCGGTTSGWTEVSAGNPVYDRRYLQSAGPFTLEQGSVNEIVVGAIWARGYYNDNKGSVCELLKADEIAQALFDNNFQLLDGPDAPEVKINEYDQELVISWGYSDAVKGVRNNWNESYIQADPVLVSQNVADSLFSFQGYIVFQLRDNTVSASELFDTDKARVVAQCDVADGVSTIVNRTVSPAPELIDPVIVDEVMVEGADEGIFHSARMTEDLFAQGDDKRLKNYMTYYYAVIAYAYNDTASDGKQFIIGNRYFQNISAVPHKIDFEQYGTVVQAEYGTELPVTMTAGTGNGGNFLKLTSASELEIFNQVSPGKVSYRGGYAPVAIEIIDPKEVRGGDYRLEIRQTFAGVVDTVAVDTATASVIIDSLFNEWMLYEDNQLIYASTYIKRSSGQSFSFRPNPYSGSKVIEGHGFAIHVDSTRLPGDTLHNGLIGSEITYTDPTRKWLSGIGDNDDIDVWNWIESGETGDPQVPYEGNRGFGYFRNNFLYDDHDVFEEAVNGSWTPFSLAREFLNTDPNAYIRPGIEVSLTAASTVNRVAASRMLNLNELHDVDIVLTPDKSKWSRCVVVETGSDQALGSGAFPMTAKWEIGIDKDGNQIDSVLNQNTQGWSWFPGYAIDLTTGERLNIFFGENSFDKVNNGDDLMFNPTSDFGSQGEKAGGRHYVYVHASAYDGCAYIHSMLAQGPSQPLGGLNDGLIFNGIHIGDSVYRNVSWTGVPMARQGYEFEDPSNMPSAASISLRVTRPWASRAGTTDFPVFEFSTRPYAAQTGITEVAKTSLMDHIRIVPNPYYAFSAYEESQLQSKVKLTNLPQQCKIRIFTLNGTLIRTYEKDSEEPDQDWDLKNQSGVPVASGVYLIHVDAGELGEKIIKFFGVMPETDLAAY